MPRLLYAFVQACLFEELVLYGLPDRSFNGQIYLMRSFHLGYKALSSSDKLDVL